MSGSSKQPRNETERISNHNTPFFPTPEYVSAENYNEDSPPRPVTLQRRSNITVACSTCKGKKKKCDGIRPRCSFCLQHNFLCEYEAEPGETRQLARKRKFDEVKRDFDNYQELFSMLRTVPEPEAARIIQLVRSYRAPSEVLQFIKHGDLLIESSVSDQDVAKTSELGRLNQVTFLSSSLKVPARPWTRVASDGIVSELVSLFFGIEHPFFTMFVDKASFLRDMRLQDPKTAKNCSPFLVNAICAYSAFISPATKAASKILKLDLRQAFFQEAKTLFDLENGKASITTAVGAYSLFLHCCSQGFDRAGLLFRFASCEALRRLNSNHEATRQSQNLTSSTDAYALCYNRVAWGIFCFESLSGIVYMQPSLANEPKAPMLFYEPDEILVGERASPRQDRFLQEFCSLGKITAKVLAFNHESKLKLGDKDDVEERVQMYESLLTWRATLFQAMHNSKQDIANMLFLKCYYSNAILGVLRPLEPFDTELPNGSGTARSLCVKHCTDIVSQLKIFEKQFPKDVKNGFPALCYISYVAGISLVPHLSRDPSSREPFTEVCRIFSTISQNLPVCSALLEGFIALATKLQVRLPRECYPYLKARKVSQPSEDVPISWAIPQTRSEKQRVNNEDTIVGNVELGEIISRYSQVQL